MYAVVAFSYASYAGYGYMESREYFPANEIMTWSQIDQRFFATVTLKIKIYRSFFWDKSDYFSIYSLPYDVTAVTTVTGFLIHFSSFKNQSKS